MIILAIETSCDETAAAIVEFRGNKVKVLSNIISSQVKAHSKYGGVVPSLAARMHLRNMVPVLKRAFERAEKNLGAKFSKEPSSEASELGSFENLIDYVAVTKGPGLIPALTIGVSAAKALSYSLDKPLVGVNHLEGHIYANWLKPIRIPNTKYQIPNTSDSNFNLRKPEFPILCLIVSGGHTQLVLMKKDLNYKIIGETMDDAVGEAFDKVAKLLGLSYPGGPLIEKIAKKGDKNKFKFTRPMMNSGNYNFSFSGLKTAVLYEIGTGHTLSATQPTSLKRGISRTVSQVVSFKNSIQYKSDIAASFQEAAIDVLVSKTIKAAKQYKVKNIILGGGVSANKELQRRLSKKIPLTPFSKGGIRFQIPNTNLSTDNALMIAVAAYYNIINNKNIKSWRSVKADANLKISTLS